MAKLDRGEVLRLIGLGIAVILESAALTSLILRLALLPFGDAYPPIVSVATFMLPSVVGLLARRLEVAVLLAILPFWILAVVYLGGFATPWNVDLFSLGLLAERVAGFTALLGLLGLFGWLVRRLLVKGLAVSSDT